MRGVSDCDCDEGPGLQRASVVARMQEDGECEGCRRMEEELPGRAHE